jgi:hypothetical protein
MISHGRSLPLDCYVILHIRAGPPYPEVSSSPQIAADSPFQLSSDIWIEKLDQEIAINIQRDTLNRPVLQLHILAVADIPIRAFPEYISCLVVAGSCHVPPLTNPFHTPVVPHH